MLSVLSQIVAIFAVLTTAVVYGTDMCAILIMKPVYARLDAATVTKVAGWGHFYGDKRMPVPGVGGVAGSILATVLALLSGRVPSAIASAVAVAERSRTGKELDRLSVKSIKADHSAEHPRRFEVEHDDLVAGHAEEATVGTEAKTPRSLKVHRPVWSKNADQLPRARVVFAHARHGVFGSEGNLAAGHDVAIRCDGQVKWTETLVLDEPNFVVPGGRRHREDGARSGA